MKGVKNLSRKNIFKISAAACAAVIVIALVLRQAGSGTSANAASEGQSVATAQVSRGNIANTVSGSGTLEESEAQDILVPVGITINKVLVESGDTVTEGQALATVDKTSVASAISDIQDSIEQIDEELEDIDEDTQSSTVTASVSGRVKSVNISTGDDAASVTEKNGSLLTISADGKMAVSFSSEADIGAGDTVKLTLSGGSTVTGSVESAAGGNVIVTVSDDGISAGDEVTVYTSDGTELGSGTLYVHQPVYLTETSGTVSKIYVSDNEKVDQGDKLYKLTGVIDEAKKNELIAQRSDLSDALSAMLKIQSSGQISADTAGTIESVNVSDDTEVTKNAADSSESSDGSSSSGNAGASVSSESGSSGSFTQASAETVSDGTGNGGFVLLSASSSTQSEGSDGNDQSVSVEGSGENSGSSSQDSASEKNSSSSGGSSDTSSDSSNRASSDSGNSASEGDSSSSSDSEKYGNKYLILPITRPSAGETPMTVSELSDAVEEGKYDYNIENIVWSGSSELDGNDTFESGKTYSAVVTITFDDDDMYEFLDKDGDFLIKADGSASVKYTYSGSTGKLTVTVKYTVSDSGSSSSGSSGTASDSSISGSSDSGSSSETSSETTAAKPDGQNTSGAATADSSSGNASAKTAGTSSGTASSLPSASAYGSSGAVSSGTVSASSGSSAGDVSGTGSSGSDVSSSGTDNASLYSAYETAGFTVSSDDTMQVSINVTELDILSVKTGQKVSVELDAVSGTVYEGEVTEVSSSGTNSGGSTKYPVTISITKDENMLEGMSATATITVSSAENVLTIPADALQERGGKSFVYTSEEDGTLSGETEVETGLADDSSVEITSGLSEGQTVYYNKLTGTDINTDSDSSGQQDMNGGQMGPGGGSSGGGMPSGGDSSGGGMPSGGPGGMPSGGGSSGGQGSN